MSNAIVARFQLHVRCEGCSQDATCPITVPNIEGAPATVDELLSSGMIDLVPFVCERCECPSSRLIAVFHQRHRDADQMTKRPMADAGRVTMYVVSGFVRDENGRLRAEQPIQMPSAYAAKRRAERYEAEGGGAIARAQTGVPEFGDWDEPEILAQCGPVPRWALDETGEAA